MGLAFRTGRRFPPSGIQDSQLDLVEACGVGDHVDLGDLAVPYD
jgi:hypothetical protein